MNFENVRPYSPGPARSPMGIGPEYEYPKIPEDPPSDALKAACELTVVQMATGGYALLNRRWKSREDADVAHMLLLLAAGTAETAPKQLTRLRYIIGRLVHALVRMKLRADMTTLTTTPEEYRLHVERIHERFGLDPMPKPQPPSLPFPDDRP
jgi:hypothetical protein